MQSTLKHQRRRCRRTPPVGCTAAPRCAQVGVYAPPNRPVPKIIWTYWEDMKKARNRTNADVAGPEEQDRTAKPEETQPLNSGNTTPGSTEQLDGGCSWLEEMEWLLLEPVYNSSTTICSCM